MTFCYTNNKIWFNGICPFDLFFNSKKSSKIYFKNMCECKVIPFRSEEV